VEICKQQQQAKESKPALAAADDSVAKLEARVEQAGARIAALEKNIARRDRRIDSQEALSM
jgi:hypothetical protein